MRSASVGESIGVSIVFVYTLFFATYALTESPAVWYDEGIYLQVARTLAEEKVLGLPVAPHEFISAAHVTVGFPVTFPIATSFKLFGVGVLQARAVMVIFILAFVGAAYMLLRTTVGYRLALLGVGLLASFPLLYGNGKNVLGEVPGLLFLTLFLYAVHRLEREHFEGFLWYGIAGLSAGLAMATKPIFILLAPAVLIVVVLKRREIVFRWSAISAGSIVAIVPIALWLATQFAGDSFAQVFAHYSNPYEIQDMGRVVWENALRFFTEMTPLHFTFFFGIWLSAMVVRIWSREKISLAESIAFAFSFLVACAFLRTAGWYRYFFVAHVFALIFTPSALAVLWKMWGHTFPRYGFSRAGGALCATVIVLISVCQTYQLGFDSWVASHYESTNTATLTAYFAGLDPTQSIFLYNDPHIAVFLSQPFYQYLNPVGEQVMGAGSLGVLAARVPDRVVVLSNVYDEKAEEFSGYTIERRIAGHVILVRR